jgi:hypothetical protein
MNVVIIVVIFESRIDGHAFWNPDSTDGASGLP